MKFKKWLKKKPLWFKFGVASALVSFLYGFYVNFFVFFHLDIKPPQTTLEKLISSFGIAFLVYAILGLVIGSIIGLIWGKLK